MFGKWVFFEAIHEAVFVPWIALLSTAGALLGLAAGYALYRDRKEQDPLQVADGAAVERARAPLLHRRLLHAGDRLPRARHLSGAVNWFNQNVIDGVVNGAAMLARGLGQVVAWFDRTVIDGVVNGAGETAGRTGNALKYLQTATCSGTPSALFVGVIALSVVFIRVV